jgi:hypothetical protein
MEDSVPGKLDALKSRVNDMDGRLTSVEKQLAENNEMTREIRTIIPVVNDIREAQVAKKWIGKRIEGAGALSGAAAKIAAGVTATGAAVVAAWHWVKG